MRTARPWPMPQRPTALADLLGPGMTRAMIRTQVAGGGLIRVREGVYVGTDSWPLDAKDQHILRARAEQVANPFAVISHHSAALAWGLPSPPLVTWLDLPPALTVPRGGQRSRISGTAQVIEAVLPAHHVTHDAAGWAVTTVSRTAVDVAKNAGLPEALVVLDAAARLICASMVAQPRRRDYANAALLDVARSQFEDACLGRRGMAVVRRAIGLADPRRESPIESLTAGHIFLAGLPMPDFQTPIPTPVGVLYPDCYWQDQRLIGEADGAGKYSTPDAILNEKEREQVFRDLGYGVVRWLGKEITFRPSVVMGRLARELGIAG